MWVAKKTPHETSGFVVANVHAFQTVPFVAESALVEIKIQGEERWTTQAVQEKDNPVVLHAGLFQVVADLPNGNVPTREKLALLRGYVLIQDIHERAGSKR